MFEDPANRVNKTFAQFKDMLDLIRMSEYHKHKMRRNTLVKFKKLEEALKSKGYEPLITSTTTGKHKDPAHKKGTAVDFVVYKNGVPISKEESVLVENICRDMGWKVFNEYIKDSTYKTGDHIHISDNR